MKKALIILALLAGAAAVGWKIYTKLAGEERGPRRGAGAVAVEVVPVRTGLIRDSAVLTGTLRARSEFNVAPKISGQVDRITVDIGDTVKKGDLIAELDDEECVQEVLRAGAELEVARARVEETRSDLHAAKREFERVKALASDKIGSERELDAAEAAYNAQTAKLKMAEAQEKQKAAELRAAEVRAAYTKIKADWEDRDGVRVVGERFVDEEAMVPANAPIVSILDIQSVTAVTHVIERDYARLRIGQDVTLHADAFPGETFAGTVARIAPLLREASRQARVEIEIPNNDMRLRPGMFVRAEVEFERVENARLIPLSALARRDGKEGVFLAEGEKARFVPVTLGIREEGTAQVLEPELEGQVVTLGHHLLEDGGRIVLPK